MTLSQLVAKLVEIALDESRGGRVESGDLPVYFDGNYEAGEGELDADCVRIRGADTLRTAWGGELARPRRLVIACGPE